MRKNVRNAGVAIRRIGAVAHLFLVAEVISELVPKHAHSGVVARIFRGGSHSEIGINFQGTKQHLDTVDGEELVTRMAVVRTL